MTFTYGDGTPAPFSIDYLKLLRGALDFAVEHLHCEQRHHTLDKKTLGLRSAADHEVKRLEELERQVAAAVEGMTSNTESAHVAACGKAIVRASGEQVRAEIEKVRAALTTDIGRVDEEGMQERQRSRAALEALLLAHDLPDTSFSIRLTQAQGERYVGRIATTSALGVDAVLELEIPEDAETTLAGVVRVETILKNVELQAPEAAGGWFSRGTQLKPQRAEAFYVTEIASGEERGFKLRANRDGTGAGWDATLDDEGAVTLVHMSDKGEATPITGDEERVRKLHEKLAAAAAEARFHRTRVVELTLDEEDFIEHEEPTVLIERLVDEMSPVVQEIARRSKSTDELVIKRIVGDTQRVEMFASKADLLEKISALPVNMREIFAELGLEGEKAPSRPAPAPKSPSKPPPKTPELAEPELTVAKAPEPDAGSSENAEQPAKQETKPASASPSVAPVPPRASGIPSKPGGPPPRVSAVPKALPKRDKG